MVFTGKIIQTGHDAFEVKKYDVPVKKRKIWHNMCLNAPNSLFGILPLYRKEYGYSSWLTAEGDMAAYLPDIGKLGCKIDRKEFLLTTKQSNEDFEFSESLKYSGC